MNDPVTEELERRAHLALGWMPALLGALAIHLAGIAAVLVAPSRPHHALTLPRVQVRLTALPVPAASAAPVTPATTAAPITPAPLAPLKAAPKRAAQPPPRHVLPEKKPAHTAPSPPAPQDETQPSAPLAPPAGQRTTALRSAGGAIALGTTAANGDESFPYSYYLNRVLGLIESNWYRPPVAEPTHCRVLCRIDRAGRLIEAGIEEASAMPAFDRAALRAVYAASPLPPLPQGYGGATLTLHLEFGP